MTATDPPPTGTPQLAAMAAELHSLREDLATLTRDLGVVGANSEHRLSELATRVAMVEQMTPAEAGAPAAGYPYRYTSLVAWVDEVFARRAARHRVKWCTNWEQHLEAYARLEVLWHTWEAAMAAPAGGSPNWAAVDEWLRVMFDHHTEILLDVDGPFAGCVPHERCSAPPRLAQRRLAPPRSSAVARIDAYKARHPAPVGATIP